MTNPDLAGRTPTVQRYQSRWWQNWLSRQTKPARLPRASRVPPPPIPQPPPVSPRPASEPTRGSAPASRPAWLVRESIALLGMAGAALTVLAQLAWLVPLSRPFMDVLGRWMTFNSDLWIANYDILGFYPHSHLQAAIALALFLSLIGLGARISARLSGEALQKNWRLFGGLSMPSFWILSSLIIVFLLGHARDPARDPLVVGGSLQMGEFAFALAIAAGYGLGDLLGQKGFHTRVARLAVLVALLLVWNQWLLSSP